MAEIISENVAEIYSPHSYGRCLTVDW